MHKSIEYRLKILILSWENGAFSNRCWFTNRIELWDWIPENRECDTDFDKDAYWLQIKSSIKADWFNGQGEKSYCRTYKMYVAKEVRG